MKHIVLYGPGTSPALLVEDDQAKEIKKAFENGESFSVNFKGTETLVKEQSCWAMKIDDFVERRGGDRRSDNEEK